MVQKVETALYVLLFENQQHIHIRLPKRRSWLFLFFFRS